MGYALLDAVSAGILSNAPLMAIKAMQASDAQLQLPVAMAAAGLFASVFTGVAMAARRKKPFIVLPGIASAICALSMAWTSSAIWFLFALGMISIFDFAVRPAVPSMLRIIYPEDCRSHVAGTLRQYASIAFLCSTLLFAWLLSASKDAIGQMITVQLTLAGLCSLAAFLCIQQLPDIGDGSAAEAMCGDTSPSESRWPFSRASLHPFRDERFRRFLLIFGLYCLGNLFYMGIVPSFFAHDLGYGYVQATLLIHVVPAVAGFLAGGRLTAWFDRTSIWRAYAVVILLWGLDPLLLAIAPHAWAVVAIARILRGPAMVGSMVLVVYTGVHRFAQPGPDTSRYMSALFLVNGIARLIAPAATALLSGHLGHRGILFSGGVVILTGCVLCLVSDVADTGANRNVRRIS